jgi:hypothetical protein
MPNKKGLISKKMVQTYFPEYQFTTCTNMCWDARDLKINSKDFLMYQVRFPRNRN